jgi:hypothetical protein
MPTTELRSNLIGLETQLGDLGLFVATARGLVLDIDEASIGEPVMSELVAKQIDLASLVNRDFGGAMAALMFLFKAAQA